MQGTRMAAAPVDDARRTPHLAPSCASGASAVLPVDANGRYTADEFMALPLDLKRYELVRGRLVEVPVTGFKHGVIEINIVLLLGQHVRRRRLGQLTPGDAKHLLERDPDTLRQPDVAFIRAERLPPPDEWEAYGRVVPDLAVEMPSNTAAEMRDKVAECAVVDDAQYTTPGAIVCVGAAAVVDANGRYTADEFMALPLDLKRYELVTRCARGGSCDRL